MCLKIVGGMVNSVDPGQMPHFAASDLGQSCFLKVNTVFTVFVLILICLNKST